MTAITMPTGPVSRVKTFASPPPAPNAPFSFVTTPIKFEIPIDIFPITIKAGPIAATTAAIFMMVCFWLSDKLLNHSENSFIFSVTFIMVGCNVSINVPPKSIAEFFNWFTAIFILLLVVSSFANAVSVAPALFPISSRTLFNFTPLSHNTLAAFPASALPNILEIFVPLKFACSSSMLNTSVRYHPRSMASAMVRPPSFICSVPLAKAIAAEVPCFPSSFNMLFKYVVVSDVAIPFDVITAYALQRLSNSTPCAFAVGITLPIALANSATVVFPKFCV